MTPKQRERVFFWLLTATVLLVLGSISFGALSGVSFGWGLAFICLLAIAVWLGWVARALA